MQQEQVKNILLVGKTGAGKSTLSNILCGGTKMFKESQNLKSETKICQSFQCKLFGNLNLPTIQICDTPGFMDTSGSDCGTIDNIFDLLDSMDDNGIHLILFCLSATEVKCDKSILDALKTLIELMGDRVQGCIYVVITQLNQINPQEIDNKCQQMKAEVPGILNEAGIQINYDPIFFYYHGANINGLEKLQDLIETRESFRPLLADDYQRLYDPNDEFGSMKKISEENQQFRKVMAQMQEDRERRLLIEQQQEEKLKFLQQQQEIDRQQREQEKLRMEEFQKMLAKDQQLKQEERRKIEEEKEKMQKEIAELKEQRRQQKQIEKEQLALKQKQEAEQQRLEQIKARQDAEYEKKKTEILLEEMRMKREQAEIEMQQKQQKIIEDHQKLQQQNQFLLSQNQGYQSQIARLQTPKTTAQIRQMNRMKKQKKR